MKYMSKKIFFLCVLLLISLFILYVYVIKKPSNTRNWESGLAIIPRIEIDGTSITIQNMRDFRYSEQGLLKEQYSNQNVDLNKLRKAWFVVEPFDGLPVKFGGIAHTYFVFDFEDQKPVVVSVEARREKDESFDLFAGMTNSFELMYVWGTEDDLTVRRVLVEDNNLYMYPLLIPEESAQQLFLELAMTTQTLAEQPRFYNSFTSNCTNELAKHANKVKPGTIPMNLVWFLPGFADDQLYKLKLIPHDAPFDEIERNYFISDLVREYYLKPNFSELLRSQLQ